MAQSMPLDQFVDQLGPFALVHRPPPPEAAQALGLPYNSLRTRLARASLVESGPIALLFSFDELGVTVMPPLGERDALVAGRQPDCDLIIDEPSASKRHAMLCWDRARARCTVQDLGSTNGTFLNGTAKVLRETELKDGDVLSFGEAHYWFLLAGTLHSRLSKALESNLLGSHSG